MSGHAATPQLEVPGIRSLRDGARRLTSYWWVLLVAGIAWVAVALVILQFDHASVTTVGILVGLMFLGAGIENIALATLDVPMRWAVGALRRRCSSSPPSSASPTRRTRSPAWPTSSASCSCSSACGGWCARSSSVRSTRSGGAGSSPGS